MLGTACLPGNSNTSHEHSRSIPDKTSVAYAVQSDDTPELIAQSLAGLIDGAYASGATVIVPNAALVEVATAGYGQITRVTRRQEQLFTVSIFTNGGNARDILGSALDAALSAQSWLATLDGQNALMQFAGASDADAMQTSSIFRRDFRFKIDHTFKFCRNEKKNGFRLLKIRKMLATSLRNKK